MEKNRSKLRFFFTKKTGWDEEPLAIFYLGEYRKFPKNFRVPYLTREQIIKEGWEFLYDDGFLNFKKIKTEFIEICYYNTLSYDINIHRLLISNRELNEEFSSIFDGKCKDINTFRYITKLLHI